MNRYALKSMTAIAISCTLAGSAMAQTSKGALAGIAKDSSGAVVANAQITIKGEQTGETRTLTTGSDGSYRADALSPEAYTISGSAAGFQGFQAQHVLVGSTLR